MEPRGSFHIFFVYSLVFDHLGGAVYVTVPAFVTVATVNAIALYRAGGAAVGVARVPLQHAVHFPRPRLLWGRGCLNGDHRGGIGGDGEHHHPDWQTQTDWVIKKPPEFRWLFLCLSLR